MYLIKRPTSFVAHWKPATTLSLISFRYYKSRLKVNSRIRFNWLKTIARLFEVTCTPLEQSIIRLGPLVSGPKHQIFLSSSHMSVASLKWFLLKIIMSDQGTVAGQSKEGSSERNLLKQKRPFR